MVSALASKVDALSQAQRDMQLLLDRLASSSPASSSSSVRGLSTSARLKVYDAVPLDSRASTAVGNAAAAADAAVAAVGSALTESDANAVAAESNCNEAAGVGSAEAICASPGAGSKRKVVAC